MVPQWGDEVQTLTELAAQGAKRRGIVQSPVTAQSDQDMLRPPLSSREIFMCEDMMAGLDSFLLSEILLFQDWLVKQIAHSFAGNTILTDQRQLESGSRDAQDDLGAFCCHKNTSVCPLSQQVF